MEEQIRQDILSALKDALKAIKADNAVELKEVSNHTIHNSSIQQDSYSIITAILTYTLAKIFERLRYREYKTWDFFYESLIENLNLAVQALQKNETEKYDHAIHLILQSMNRLEPKFKKYAKEIMQKAKISKASRIYEHGISMGRTAELLGISEWELMSYTGETGISDVPFAQTRTIKQRMNFIRGLFK